MGGTDERGTDGDLAGSGACDPRDPDAPSYRDGIDHADDLPAAASRARCARWTSTCGIRPPGRLPAGAAEIDRGGFFTMAHAYQNRYQKTTRQAVRRPLDGSLFPVTVIGIVSEGQLPFIITFSITVI